MARVATFAQESSALMAFRVVTRLTNAVDFVVGSAHANTGVAGFQNDLRDALKNPDVTDIVIMDDSNTGIGRFTPWALRMNGRPV